jgi:hypothetical protein
VVLVPASPTISPARVHTAPLAQAVKPLPDRE